MPVVSSSSPPDSHGVGSSISDMCTHRTGTSVADSPVSRRTSRSDSSSETVSIACVYETAAARRRSGPRVHHLAGTLQDRAQDPDDLVELVGPGDHRGGQLPDRGPPGTGATN